MTDASSLWQQFQPQRHQYQMLGSPFLFPVSVCLYIYMCVCVCVCMLLPSCFRCEPLAISCGQNKVYYCPGLTDPMTFVCLCVCLWQTMQMSHGSHQAQLRSQHGLPSHPSSSSAPQPQLSQQPQQQQQQPPAPVASGPAGSEYMREREDLLRAYIGGGTPREYPAVRLPSPLCAA